MSTRLSLLLAVCGLLFANGARAADTATASALYTGGKVAAPTYQQVSRGGTGHAEAVRVRYDPRKVSYEQLLDYFWRHIDPTVKDRQFCDIGSQYRSAIFYQDAVEEKAARASLQALQQSGRFKHIHTEIVPAATFYLAEEYHQDYYKKSPVRDARVEALWGESH